MAAITADGREELVALYLTMFGRAPLSLVRFAEMVTARENGATLADVAADLATDPAFALVASQDAESFATYLADALLADDIPAAAREWAENWVVTNLSGRSKAEVIADAVQAIRATGNTNYASSQAELNDAIDAAIHTVYDPDHSAGTFRLTTGVDYADTNASYKNGGLLPSTFTFTDGDDVVTAGAGALNSTDALADDSSTDNDVLSATLVDAAGIAPIIQGIETINLTSSFPNAKIDFAGVFGAKNLNITGAASIVIENIDAVAAPAIALDNYSKTANLKMATMAGQNDALNVTVSSTTVSGGNVPTLNLDATTGGPLESLTLESAGATDNTLEITGGAGIQGVVTATITGAADLDLRMAHALINGRSLDATGHKGVLGLSVNREGAGTATTNLTNVIGVDAYTFTESGLGATLGDEAIEASGLANGSTVTLAYDPTAGSLAVKGAASSSTNSLTLVLDHATQATNISVAGLAIADVETVNLVSEGGTTAGNSITGLDVAASSRVTVGGSTKLSLELDAAVSTITVSGSGAHAISFAAGTEYSSTHLTINASAATGKLTLDGSELEGSATGTVIETITIRGGSNDDTITGSFDAGTKNVVDARAGNDTVRVSTVNDSDVTLGAGSDEVLIDIQTVNGSVTFTDFARGTDGDALSLLGTQAAVEFGAVAATAVAGQLTLFNVTVANDGEARQQLDIGGEAAILVINNATGIAELWYDDNGAGTDGVKLASFENITTVGALTNAVTGFTAANFGGGAV